MHPKHSYIHYNGNDDDDDEGDDDALSRLWDADSDTTDNHWQYDEDDAESNAFTNPRCDNFDPRNCRSSHAIHNTVNTADDDDNDDDEIPTSPSSRSTPTTTVASRSPPSYLMTAILAGLYELPPPHILRYQTGWGRRIRYHQVHHIPTYFQNLPDAYLHDRGRISDAQPTGPAIQFMTLQRYSHFQFLPVDTPTVSTTTQNLPSTRKRATQCHEFNIYRVQRPDSNGDYHPDMTATSNASILRNMNAQLRQLAYREIQHHTMGLNVSNAGGTYHGLPNFFHNIHFNTTGDDDSTGANASGDTNATTTGDCCKLALYQHIRQVMERIEQYESSMQQPQSSDPRSSSESSSSSTSSDSTSTSPLTLALDSQDIECWVNVSETNGSWNRLHTHEGSAYSGVYYVSSSSSSSDTITNDWNGNFVVKPTPHPLEDTYTLSSHEQSRLRRCSSEKLQQLPYIDEVHYVMIPPTPGTMILFPSYVHHCVLPLEVVETETNDVHIDETHRRRRHHQTNHNNNIKSDNQNPSRISIAFNINWNQQQDAPN